MGDMEGNQPELGLLDRLFLETMRFDRGDAKRIQHFTKVHSYARLIARSEGMSGKDEFTLEAAAIVHDIGIRVAEEKYGYQNGKLQEQEGPAAAGELMRSLGFPDDVTDRVCFLVGHHHTYANIDALDYQILVEADFIVNLYEDGAGMKTILAARRNIFRTETGIRILDDMFGIHEGIKCEADQGKASGKADKPVNPQTADVLKAQEGDR